MEAVQIAQTVQTVRLLARARALALALEAMSALVNPAAT
jgi:hypothetical protein